MRLFHCLWLLALFPESLLKESESAEKAMGKYECRGNQVLVITDIKLPHSVDTRCAEPPICKKQLDCASTGPCTGQSGLEFVNTVQERTKNDPLETGCCTYGPQPDEYVKTECVTFSISNSRDRKRRKRRNYDESSLIGMLNRRKRGAEVFVKKDKGKKNIIMIVNDIQRIGNGYTIRGCTVLCQDTTTTSTTPTTTQQSDEDSSSEERGLGKFQCPPGQVLTIYDQNLPYVIHIKCDTPNICDQKTSCMPSPDACPSPKVSGLSFLQLVNEQNKYDRLEKGCCTYEPIPDEYVNTECNTYFVTDRRRAKQERTIDRSRRPASRKAISSGELFSRMEKYLANTRRDKREAGQAEIYRNSVKNKTKSIMLVNDIERISNGYSVVGCTIQCRRSSTTTTTTKTPSTRSQKLEQPDYVDEIPEKEPPKPKAPEPPKETHVDEPLLHIEPPVETVPKPSPPVSAPVAPPPAPCFAAHSQLQTPNGPKRMDQLEIGDQVLVTVSDGVDVFEPVEMWYHRLSDEFAEFVVLGTGSRELWLTPGHLLPLVPCSMRQLDSSVLGRSVFASRAQPGMCLVGVHEGQMSPEPLVSVQRRWVRGIYSPITAHGSVVVDHVLSSCFTTLENHNAQQNIHYLLRYAYNLYQTITNTHLQSQKQIDIPLPMRLVLELAYLILPETMFFCM